MRELIDSLLDTDLYKFTMMQCVFHQLPPIPVSYRFISRKPIDLIPIAPIIQENISALCQLTFKEEELDYLASLPFFKKDFIDFLRSFRLEEKYVELKTSPHFELKIHGPWLNTILFEIPLLAIISESYYRYHFPQANYQEGRQRLSEKIAYLQKENVPLHFCDFGTRRRFSYHWQDEVIATVKEKLAMQFVGTSNMYFAKKYQLKPFGTMAHEFLQAFQAIAPEVVGSQKLALETWLKEYPHDLGIALSDTLTMDVFLKEFDKNLSTQFQGMRQDSGSPFIWAEKAIAHYEKFGIRSQDKTFVFSDNLTFKLMVEIFNAFKDKAQIFFGIGTNLTNDLGYSPLDIVIKMTHANDQPVAKISDSKGKIICDDSNYLNHIKKVLHLQD